MVGWWPADGNGSDIGGTNTATLQGGATANAPGMVGTGFGFDGTNGYVRIADSSAFHPTNLTIEAWVRFTSLDSAGLGGSPAGDQYIVFKQNTRSGNFEGFDLGKTRSGGSDYFRFLVASAGGQPAEVRSITAVVTNTWYHIAGIRGSNFLQLYVNGQLERQTNVSFPQDYGNLPLFFGSSGQSFWDHKFKGTLDEVSLYSRALSSNEIAAVFVAGTAGKCGTPRVLSSPLSQTAVAGTNVTLAAAVSGNEPLTFQWQFNSSNLTSTATTNLVLTNVQPVDAGNYRLTVSNAAGSATSAVAVLTVLIPPSFVSQPQPVTNVVGGTASFNAFVSGTTPLIFQWRFSSNNISNGGRISGATTTNLTITSLQEGDAGAYSLVASNAAGTAMSVAAFLTVLTPPTITSQPQNWETAAGSAFSLDSAASGSAPLVFRWQKNGTNLADDGRIIGSSSNTLFFNVAQTNDSGGYSVVVSNSAGAITSAVATVIVTPSPTLPTINLQPASQTANSGGEAVFSVAVSGTPPLSYQWQRNGTNLLNGQRISGALTSSLALHDAVLSDAGDYRVMVSNSAGSVTSLVATLTVNAVAPIGSDAVVLINSSSPQVLDFQRLIQPYLDNFGVPYTVQDISTNAIGSNISRFALIIVGHKQLDTPKSFLTPFAQANISAAVSNGTGLVNFDSDLATGATPRYQYIQDIFGFTYGSGGSASAVTFPATEPGSQLHFVSSRHATNESITLRSGITVAGLVPPANATAIVMASTRPLVTVKKYGQGRAVQWSSYDWVSYSALGPVGGMDDLVWRGLVWAARKPFAMHSMPNFVTMRVDDVEGPISSFRIANEVGFKPFLALFVNLIDETEASELRQLVTNGNATTSIHSWDFGNAFFYWNHTTGAPWPDNVMSNNFYVGTQWHLNHGIPISKVVASHYSEFGLNAFAGLQAWGVEYFPIEIVVGNTWHTGVPWLLAGPYRLYQTGAGDSLLPLYYADFLTVPGHPEFNGVFFNQYTEIRDMTVSGGTYNCGEFCPDNDVAGSIGRGTKMLRRGLDGLCLATLLTHDRYVKGVTGSANDLNTTSNNWRNIMKGITNNLASYNPIFVTLDHGNQYARALKTSRLLSCSYDTISGRVNATMTGKADLETFLYVYQGTDNSISNVAGTLSPFTNSGPVTMNAATLSVAPMVLLPPSSRTNNAGTTASFPVISGGSAPLTYRWFRDGTNLLNDGGNISGAASAVLILNNVLHADGGGYSVIVSNISGSVTSTPAAVLTVIDPVITMQPAGRTNHQGTPASFGVAVSGTDPKFQWLKNGSPLPDATNLTMNLPSISASDEGSYSAIVSNDFGNALSAPAALAVKGPLIIELVTATNDATVIGWSSIPGLTYSLQYLDSLADDWQTQLPPLVASGTNSALTNATSLSNQRFYRLFLHAEP